MKVINSYVDKIFEGVSCPACGEVENLAGILVRNKETKRNEIEVTCVCTEVFTREIN